VYQSQPYDLTDLDWSPELWIACHDDDEQNARFAQHVWEDNGLDVPSTYMNELSTYLGEPNLAAFGLSISLHPLRSSKCLCSF